MKRAATLIALVALFVPAAHAHREVPPPRVQLALLLDTSNSMDGLIGQAKTQLWSIVNEFATARRDGVQPTLEVALFEYGNTGLPAEEGYIRQVVPLTTDLDQISESLFALTTNGGDEYCGQVIQEAVRRLTWSNRPRDFKAIFIAGNEPFIQGPVHYTSAAEMAAGRGVIVNTIHCGSYDDGVAGRWLDGAKLAGGSYMHIDQDRTLPPIICPQDERLMQLNVELNNTYVWYGDNAERYATRQKVQDANAASRAPQALSARIATKAGGMYRQADKDLVDAFAADEKALSKLKEDHLPETMRTMTEQERVAYVKGHAARRAGLQREIQSLSAERAKYVAKVRAEQVEAGETTLGEAINATIRDQIQAAGFETKTTVE